MGELAKAKETIKAMLACLLEAEDVLENGLFSGADERAAMLDAHSAVRRAQRLAYGEVAVDDLKEAEE